MESLSRFERRKVRLQAARNWETKRSKQRECRKRKRGKNCRVVQKIPGWRLTVSCSVIVTCWVIEVQDFGLCGSLVDDNEE